MPESKEKKYALYVIGAIIVIGVVIAIYELLIVPMTGAPSVSSALSKELSISISPSSISQGQNTQYQVSNATPGGQLNFKLQTEPTSQHGSLTWSNTADANGNDSGTIYGNGAFTPGTQDVTVTDVASGQTATAKFTFS
jgi:hypothetical protein